VSKICAEVRFLSELATPFKLDFMTSRIQTLPEDVVHLIAAGEVIDSLAAAVRELVENSLDAGATRISVSVWIEQWKVRVADNGFGMALADLKQAASAHSTSKIHERQDLWSINSLGFRGEALHSLAQLADLEICSRWTDSADGWWMKYDNQGNPIEMEVMAIAPGTIVTASHLFSNWLPRRHSLPTPTQQLRMIQATIQQIALCHPQVTWQVEQSDRPWFSIWTGATAKQILSQLLREVQPGDLYELTINGGNGEGEVGKQRKSTHPSSPILHSSSFSQPPTLYILLGLPDRCHRYRPDWVRVAINGRAVKSPELEQTILSAFRRTLPRDRHPVCFLHLHISPDLIDWNRHPAKAEIYLRDMNYWREQVSAAIAQALRLSSAELPDSAHSGRIGQLLRTSESQGAYNTNRSIQGSGKWGVGSGEQDDIPISHLKALAQVHNMYILAEHPTGIWLVEQHIAHERVLYEQLCDRWQVVPLEPPILLSQLSHEQVEQLQRIGLEIELFGDHVWAVRTAPERLTCREDCPDALLELSLGGDLESALVATACRTAIRNGTPLTLPDMQILLNQWQQTRNPHTCPHGRPICLTLEESSLSHFFRRHWVIGKSHGI
jgi:DNA mismatch repair protein MutL